MVAAKVLIDWFAYHIDWEHPSHGQRPRGRCGIVDMFNLM